MFLLAVAKVFISLLYFLEGNQIKSGQVWAQFQVIHHFSTESQSKERMEMKIGLLIDRKVRSI